MHTTHPRQYWVDVTKAIGIFLVYYAHVLQATYHFSTDAVFFQYKLIYAFHIPLFFFISGFFYRRSGYPLLTEIGVQFQKRIFPVFLFGAVSLALWPLYTFLTTGQTDLGFVLANALGYLQGRPGLNAAIWFLVCLFMVDVWAALLLPRLNSVLQGVLLSCAVLYFGYSLTITPEFEDFFLIPRNFWYFHESVVAFGFFSMGYATFPWVRRLTGLRPMLRLALASLLAALTVWTVNLNSPEEGFVVLMKISKHGNYYFFISAFSGSLATILLASLVPRLKGFEYLGRNTLILMGTNGLFIEFFNHHLIRWLDHYDSTAWVTFDSLWISLLTIGLSIPLIELLNRWLPQLVGRPQADGPLLRAFPPPRFRLLTKFIQGISRLLGDIQEDLTRDFPAGG